MIRQKLAMVGVLLAIVLHGGSCSSSSDPVEVLADLIALEKIFGPIDNGGSSLLDQFNANHWDAPVGGLTPWSAPEVDGKAPTHSGTDINGIGVSGKYISQDDLDVINEKFPEGHGSLGYSVYGESSLAPGWYMFAWMQLENDILIDDDERYYDYAAVFDADGNSGNNFQGSTSFPDDFFVGTDFWLRLSKSPNNSWSLTATDARNNSFDMIEAQARAMVCDNALVFLIAMSGMPSGAMYYPSYRMTTFTHTGDFGRESGDWSGDDFPFRHDSLAKLSWDQRLAATPRVDLKVSYASVGSNFLSDQGLSLDLSYRFNDARDTFFGANSTHEDTVFVEGTLLGGMDSKTIIPLGAMNGIFLPYAQFNLENQDPDSSVFTRLPGAGDFELTDPLNFGTPTNLNVDLLAPQFNSNFSETFDWELRAAYATDAVRDSLLETARGMSDAVVIDVSESWLYTRQNGLFHLRNERGNVNDLESSFQNAVNGIGADNNVVDVGITLDITPRIVGDQIQIEWVPSTRGLSFVTNARFDIDGVMSAARIPVIERGGLAATIVVDDGGTVVLGGIRDINTNDETSGVPLLANIPLLNRAFQNDATMDDTRTLIVFITATIIRDNN